ncbi:adenosine kinase [Falsigemmobacter faecalis]|uniref:Adenosine kinase n=1 Tax=Falsigemmobacter faecalis TaxID=2488730 RepID=A0A3P3DK46_9RHOB|nr:adenosine kinase [Falsigemmobacter faecalis]RRH73972.1 adenosine kinase [Falsigemmobacter faecalis]
MKSYQVTGIGNAIVDVLTRMDDEGLAALGITKGVMTLVDQARCEALYAGMEDRSQIPGGSVGNTVAGLGALGLRTACIGKVAADEIGHFAVDALAAEGIAFPVAPVQHATLPTSRCMIFVSPDGERSMNTYLGISAEFGPEDLPEEVIRDSEILFLEGYLFDKDPGKAAFLKAARLCREAGGRAGLSLSDPFCVDRHRGDFRALVQELDFVIGNEHEWAALYQTETLTEALDLAAAQCPLVVCTRSGEGVTIRQGATSIDVPVSRIAPLDTTGAGDQFAAGFLYGLATGRDLETAGRMGCIAAAEVITHFGARPDESVLDLFRKAGLL